MSQTAVQIEEPVLLRKDNGSICTLTLNRPSKFNAMSEELLEQLFSELGIIAEQKSVRVVILAANGRAFCSGHDLKKLGTDHSETYYQEVFDKSVQLMMAIQTLPQPVIAMVQGMATAAGCQLVATCDLAVAADDVQFAVSGINLGLFCSTPSVALSRKVNRKIALEMLLTGDFIDAPTALANGLINHSVAIENLESITLELAAKIAAKPPESIRLGKKLFYSQIEKSTYSAYQEARDTMANNMLFPNTKEGINAFIQKRPPNWD